MPVVQGSPKELRSKLLLRGLVVWLVFIIVESVLGTLRILFVETQVGAEVAQRIGLIAGSVALLAVAYLFINWLGAAGWAALVEVGVFWVVLTFFFEMGIGHLRGRNWQSLLADYNVMHGGLMSVAMVLLLFAPLIARTLRSRKPAALRR